MSEILGAIFKTILALLGVAAVVVIANTAFNNNKNSNAVTQMSQLVMNIQSAFPNSSFTGLDNATATAGDKGARLAPEDMISGAGTLTNPWGGGVTVAVGSPNTATFTIATADVSASGCVKLASTIDNAQALQIGSTPVTLPVDPSTLIKTTCGSSNDMTFTFTH